jgi:YHS domain-containing protein
MVRLLIYILLLYVIYSLVKRLLLSAPKDNHKKDSSGMISEMVQDPFCKTYIPRNEAYRAVLGGNEILFCSKECAEKYKTKLNN